MAEELQPPSDFARGVLQMIAVRPLRKKEVNAGVADRLLRGGLVEQKSEEQRRGKARYKIFFLHITDAGTAELTKPKGGA